jgi:hypothetical protein
LPFPFRLSHVKYLVLCYDTFSHTLNSTHIDIQIHVNIFSHRSKQFFSAQWSHFLESRQFTTTYETSNTALSEVVLCTTSKVSQCLVGQLRGFLFFCVEYYLVFKLMYKYKGDFSVHAVLEVDIFVCWQNIVIAYL